LIEKIDKKLQGWKGKLLSLEDIITLLNLVISVIPLYWMSLYRLPTHVRNDIDKIRKKNYGMEGILLEKKYHLIS
jgi:hypothetical protein